MIFKANKLKLRFRRPNLLFLSFFSFLFIVFAISTLESAQEFHYRAYNNKTNETIDRSVLKIIERNQKRIIMWTVNENDNVFKHEYMLDENDFTRYWLVDHERLGYYYQGERRDNIVNINGKLKRKRFTKSFTIDDKPFIFNPKIGLRNFILSDQLELDCWTFVSSYIKMYEMNAKKKGFKKIIIDNNEFDVVEVEWAPRSVFLKWFKQTFYFRQSDGIYISQEPYKNYKMDIVL